MLKIPFMIAGLIIFSACEQARAPAGQENTGAAGSDNTSYFLKDTAVTILWSAVNNEDPSDTEHTITNEEYLNAISDPEKAALSFATMGEGPCEYRYISKINSKFQMLTSMAQQSRSSDPNTAFLRRWFRKDEPGLKKIEAGPEYSYTQKKLEEVKLAVKNDTIKVWLRSNAVNVLEGKSWKQTREIIFRLDKNELYLIKETRTGKDL